MNVVEKTGDARFIFGKSKINLPDFIPWTLASVTHVDAVKQKCQRGGVETELAVSHIGGFGPGERALFQPFCQNPKSEADPGIRASG